MINVQGRLNTLYKLLEKADRYGNDEEVARLKQEIEELKRSRHEPRPAYESPRPFRPYPR